MSCYNSTLDTYLSCYSRTNSRICQDYHPTGLWDGDTGVYSSICGEKSATQLSPFVVRIALWLHYYERYDWLKSRLFSSGGKPLSPKPNAMQCSRCSQKPAI